MGHKRTKNERKQASRAAAGRGPREEQAKPRDWGDEVAQRRTADDPRVMAPHDRAGRPSTGRPL